MQQQEQRVPGLRIFESAPLERAGELFYLYFGKCYRPAGSKLAQQKRIYASRKGKYATSSVQCTSAVMQHTVWVLELVLMKGRNHRY